MVAKLLFVWTAIFCSCHLWSNAIVLRAGPGSHARYPPWNGCQNASFSFDFKTTQTGEAFLWYVDDGGGNGTDYFYVILNNGTVRFVVNVVSNTDTKTDMSLGERLNDGKWHSVRYERRRAISIFTVDSLTDTDAFLGNDFEFGTGKLSNVWIGGMPSDCVTNLFSYSLPSACLDPRFNGAIRNVVYNNCTCQSSRVRMLDGSSVENTPLENCFVRDPCSAGCVCVSTDVAEPECDCSQLGCLFGGVTHYHLSMDEIKGNLLVNDGLEAYVHGVPVLVRGVNGTAIEVDAMKSITVSGPGHRAECLGDLTKCDRGYTLSLWLNITHPIIEGEHVYLSNGGHSSENHGVAMIYKKGSLKMKFKNKLGKEWLAGVYGVLPGNWHHIAASWDPGAGLNLYLDGVLVDSLVVPRAVAAGDNPDYKNFLIGRPNDASMVYGKNKIRVDEFHFWSEFRNETQIRETGPLYSIKLPMDREDMKDVVGGEARVVGEPKLAPGLIGSAANLDKTNFIDACYQGDSCIGNLSLCLYGMTVAFWLNFRSVENGAYVLSTGDEGLRLYIKNGQLIAEAERGGKVWHTIWPTTPLTNRWYFIECSWDVAKGLSFYVDQNLVSRSEVFQNRRITTGGDGHLYIGSPGPDHPEGRRGNIFIDDLELWYGDRDRLVDLGFILRGKPWAYHIPFDEWRDGRPFHPLLNIDLSGTASRAAGKLGESLRLEQGFASLGSHQSTCLGNLDVCGHGVLLSAWIKPISLENGMDFLSTGSNGIKMRQMENGKTRIVARTTAHEWQLETNLIRQNEWQFLEIDWHQRSGLRLFIDQSLVAESNSSAIRESLDDANPDRYNFHIGRGDGTRSGSQHGSFFIDEFTYWYANRDYLRTFGHIQRGVPQRMYISMDQLDKGTIGQGRLDVFPHSNPTIDSGKLNKAVSLNGNKQYLDVGNQENCFGDLTKCSHGFTGSFFFKFREHKDGTYYFSNGGGISMYERDGKLFVSADRGNELWEVSMSNPEKDIWHFFEFTWHPEKGLELYANNHLVGKQATPTSLSTRKGPKGNFFIGYGNPRDSAPSRLTSSANGWVDELEVWQSHRDYLVAFDHILRGNIQHYSFPMEKEKSNKILHPEFDVIMHNGAHLVQGRVGNSIQVGDGHYVTLGDQRTNCMGDLSKCTHGLTASFLFKPSRNPTQNGYILSSGGYTLFYRNGKYVARFQMGKEVWEVTTDKLRPEEWQKVDLSWDQRKGLQVFVDGSEVASTAHHTTGQPRRDHVVYLGRPSDDLADGQYGEGSIDELEFWFANRDHLKAFDFIQDGVKSVKVGMDDMKGDQLVNLNRTVQLHGGPTLVSGIHGRGVRLNGSRQYVDVGRDLVCQGDVSNCQRGFTGRIKLLPYQLQDNTYFISSPYLKLYQLGGQLVGEVKTEGQAWRTYSSPLVKDAWNQVDLSWHPADGLTMFVNNVKVDESFIGQKTPVGEFNKSKTFYVGRADTDMVRENYANALVDDLELYEAKRDWLVPSLIDPVEDQRLINLQTTFLPRTLPTSTVSPFHRIGKWMVFDGMSSVHFDGSKVFQDFDNTNETLYLRFQTNKSDGLLWYLDGSENKGHLSLKDGSLHFISNWTDGSRAGHRTFKISDRLNDGRWHELYINQDGDVRTVMLDGNRMQTVTDSNFKLISPGGILLGGAQSPGRSTSGFTKSNFNGKISHMTMSGNNLPHDADLVQTYLRDPRSLDIIVSGTVTTVDARQEGRPTGRPTSPDDQGTGVTFTQQWVVSVPTQSSTKAVDFNFKTSHPNGLLLLGRNSLDNFSLELSDGKLYATLGSSRYPFDTSPTKLNDLQSHHVGLDFTDDGKLRLTLDDQEKSYDLPSPKRSFRIGDNLLIGGTTEGARLPWKVLNWGDDLHYKGCLWGLKLDPDGPFDLADYARRASRNSGLRSGCLSSTLECQKNPCKHGTCRDIWNDYVCDCSQTSYHGRQCNMESPLANFNGDEQISVSYFPVKRSHSNDISMRFRTPKSNGFLASTSNEEDQEFLRILLEDGRGKVETNLGGRNEVLFVDCKVLSDNEWHTLYLRRRGDTIEANVDRCPSSSVELTGSDFELGVGKMYIGKRGPNDRSPSSRESFAGSLQNVLIDGEDLIVDMKSESPKLNVQSNVHIAMSESENVVLYPATFRENQASYLELPSLKSIHGTVMKLLFKTSDPNGLILFNGAATPTPSSSSMDDYFALELVNGSIVSRVNDRPVEFKGDFADGQWHSVELKPDPSVQDTLQITLDGSKKLAKLSLSRSYSELYGDLYVGGVPEGLLLSREIVSKGKGYTGCLASYTLNERVYNMVEESKRQTDYVTNGCTDTKTFCSADICQHQGTCSETIDTFHCDCSLTAFVGPYCEAEPEGFMFGLQREPGIVIHRIEPAVSTNSDDLAFGFMTQKENGTIVRVDGLDSNDFIEARMEKGNLAVRYDVGDGVQTLLEDAKKFNDGGYHYAAFQRSGGSATLRVDDLETKDILVPSSGSSKFDNMNIMAIGGNVGTATNKIVNPFYGIIAGVHLNSRRITDDERVKVVKRGDILPASHPFTVPEISPELEKSITTSKEDEEEEEDLGGGAGWSADSIITDARSSEPQTAAVFAAPSPGRAEGAPRAAAVTGAMMGCLLAASSIMWAAYKLKPGWFKGGSSGVLKISSPSGGAYQPVVAKDVSMTGIGLDGPDGGYSIEAANPIKSSSTAFGNSRHVSSAVTDGKTETSFVRSEVQGSKNGVVEFSGTINRGNQTDFVESDFSTIKSGRTMNIYDTTASFSTIAGNRTNLGNHGYTYDQGFSHNTQRHMTPPTVYYGDGGQYQMRNTALNYSNYNQFNQQDVFSQQHQQHMPQLVPQHQQHQQFQQQQHNAQQQFLTQQFLQQQQQQLGLQQQRQQSYQQQQSFATGSSATPIPPPPPNLMNPEEMRVDCVQLTTNGRYVVTGSIHGPPQVWDMKTGELIRIMHGDDLSSTDLHLANGDTLLIGQVADQSLSPSSRGGGFPSSPPLPGNYRKLQIWDFNTGKPMEMRNNEFCTASCMMSDGDRMVLGRTEKMGRGTTVVIWDILGNEPVRTISWPAFVGSYDDPLSFITLSKDNRYILAGAQNSSDGSANYVTFDLTVTDYDRLPPNVVSFNAQVEATAVLENHEAVTGTRQGELVIWSLRTGRALRQLVTPSSDSGNVVELAHRGEVTCLCLSKDGVYLVSASADGSVKIWNMESERIMRTLLGHQDEVWCCTISNDNELVVSGSRDNTIRLWRVEDGGPMTSIQTGVNVFRVLLSNNKRTVVALADKFGSRKLVMLQVVRTKVKSAAGSRATSPMGTFSLDANYRY